MTEAKQLQARLIARAWRDPAFKAKLLADPHAALKDAGLVVRDGITVKVLENTDRQVHLVLPPRPSGEMSEADLHAVAGGGGSTIPEPEVFLSRGRGAVL